MQQAIDPLPRESARSNGAPRLVFHHRAGFRAAREFSFGSSVDAGISRVPRRRRKKISIQDPWPGSLEPRDRAVALLDNAIDGERPALVEFPRSLVVKNGSKIRSMISGSCPRPSPRRSFTHGPRARFSSRGGGSPSGSVFDVAITASSGGMASRVRWPRIDSAWPICPRSADHPARAPGTSSIVISTSSPIRRRSIFSLSDHLVQIDRLGSSGSVFG